MPAQSERARWTIAGVTTLLLASGVVLLFVPSLRFIGGAILLSYLVIVKFVLRYTIWRDHFRSQFDRARGGRPPVPYEERVRVLPREDDGQETV